MENERKKHTIFLNDEVWDLIRDNYKSKAKSYSEFIELGMKFYCAYLAANNAGEFLPEATKAVIDDKFDHALNRICSLLFKNAVEQDIMMHIIASDTDIDDVTLSKLRGHCVQEVKASHADVSFLKALRYQKEIIIDPNWE